MKALFLDIDGVLNFEGTEARTPDGAFGIVDRLVKKLKTIIDNTNALVVLSTDWKSLWDSDAADLSDLPPDGQYLVKKLRRHGVHIASKINDRFPDKYRGAAIIDWVAEHKSVESWCVLDDVLFDDYLNYKGFTNHLVLTNPETGLTDSDVAMAIDILNRQE